MLHFPLCLAHCDSGRCWKAEGLSLLLEYKYFDKVFRIVLPDLIWISHILHMSRERYFSLLLQKMIMIWLCRSAWYFGLGSWSNVDQIFENMISLVVNLLSKIWCASDWPKGQAHYKFLAAKVWTIYIVTSDHGNFLKFSNLHIYLIDSLAR